MTKKVEKGLILGISKIYINIHKAERQVMSMFFKLVVIDQLMSMGNAEYFIHYINIINEKKIKYTTGVTEVICSLLELNFQLETG